MASSTPASASVLPATENPSLHEMAAPVRAIAARVSGELASAVHHVQLAHLAARIGHREQPHRIGGRCAGGQQRQPARAVVGIEKRLASRLRRRPT